VGQGAWDPEVYVPCQEQTCGTGIKCKGSGADAWGLKHHECMSSSQCWDWEVGVWLAGLGLGDPEVYVPCQRI
jgi:hypothetical protein